MTVVMATRQGYFLPWEIVQLDILHWTQTENSTLSQLNAICLAFKVVSSGFAYLLGLLSPPSLCPVPKF